MRMFLVEALINASWQLPLIAGGIWLAIRIARPGPAGQYRLWLASAFASAILPFMTAHLPAAPIDLDRIPVEALLAAPTAPLAADPGRFALNDGAVTLLCGAFLAVTALFACRILLSWMATRALLRRTEPSEIPPSARRLLGDLALRFAVSAPETRESAGIAGPAVVGVTRPLLILPQGFWDQHDEAVLAAALGHELAHLRRRDYLVNLVCQALLLPVVWHPAALLIHARLNKTREMACDAMAAGAMNSRLGYAQCLASVASQAGVGRRLVLPSLALGVFNGNSLEERIMSLTEAKLEFGRFEKLARIGGGLALMAAAAAIAACFHVTPVLAMTEEPPVELPAPTQIVPAPDAPPVPAAPRPAHKPPKPHGHNMVYVDRDAMSAEDRVQFDQDMAEMRQRVREATRQFDSAEFRQQLAQVKQIDAAKMAQLAELEKQYQAKKIEVKIAEMQREIQRLDERLKELKTP